MVNKIGLFISSNQGIQDSTYSTTRIDLQQPILLDNDKKYYLKVCNAQIPYVQSNIFYLKNSYFTFNTTATDIIEAQIPSGLYSLSGLNEQINNIINNSLTGIASNVIEIDANTNTGSCFITYKVKVAGFEIFFYDDATNTGNKNIMSILGFPSTFSIWKPTFANENITSPNLVMLNTLNTIYVTCNIVNSCYYNGKNSNIIAAIIPNVDPFSSILFDPQQVIEIPVSTKNINSIYFELRDQNFQLLDMKGEIWTLSIQIYDI